MNKIEVDSQNLIIYPEKYYDFFGIEQIPIRKSDIKAVEKITDKSNSDNKENMYGILIKTIYGTEYIEWFNCITQHKVYSEREIVLICNKRYCEIKSELRRNK